MTYRQHHIESRGAYRATFAFDLYEESMEVVKLQQLNEKMERLIARCRQLESDNAAMKAQQDAFHRERMQLMQKNDMARSKIEAMIGRLKSLEQSS
tara:strand:- start:16498 stop:16785 length:288 start_codon:yes stop_codon:yes gene_type:complete